MKKALIIDLSLDQDFFLLFEKDINPYVKSQYVNGFSSKYPDPQSFSLVVFSGSQYSINDDYDWLAYAMDYYLKCRDKSVRVLGICYGHQLIARAHGGKKAVGRAEKLEMDFIDVEVLGDKKIFSGLPSVLKVIGAHYDEVKKIPEKFEVIAQNRACPVQAMLCEEGGVLGLQFHPEMDGMTAKKLFIKETEKLKKYNMDVPQIIQKMPDGRFGAQVIFRNFIEEFVTGGKK